MSVTQEIIEDDCKLVIRVSGHGLNTADDISAILDDLDKALTALETEMSTSDHYYFQIVLDLDGVTPKAGAFNPEETSEDEVEPNDPWCSFCPDFWTKALADPAFKPRVDSFVERFQSILREAKRTAISAPSEFDEVQLGEPLMAHLALSDPQFVPHYIGFLRLWDPGHEVYISEAVDEILAHHGIREETKELLSYVLLDGDFGLDTHKMLLSRYDSLDPNAAHSILFRRYIALAYQGYLHVLAEDCRLYMAGLRTEAPGTTLTVPERHYEFQFDQSTAYGRAESQIVSEIQSQHKTLGASDARSAG